MYSLKAIFKSLFSVILVLALLLFVWSINVSRFSALKGAHTFYLNSPSSQALIKRNLTLADFGKIRGESVCLTGSATLEEILQEYGAKVLFEEEVGGVRSYYCYASCFSDGLQIGEYFVNLHIAMEGERCTVGSPIIFGGF